MCRMFTISFNVYVNMLGVLKPVIMYRLPNCNNFVKSFTILDSNIFEINVSVNNITSTKLSNVQI